MIQHFVNRENELKILEERYKSNKPEFLILYGRRRVGKTELILHFIKDKPSVYFLAEERRDEENRLEMQKLMSEFLNDEEFSKIKFEDWVSIFKSFTKRIKKRVVLVLDEFPYLVKGNSSISSQFQKSWDIFLSKSNLMLILVGSSISMMEKLLGEKSPLHGRRTGQLEVKPVRISEIKKFLPSYTLEDCINVYGCVDGIPLYLNQFDKNKEFFKNVEENFLRRDKILYSEAEILLRQEFREISNYFSILKAISFGYLKHGEIAEYTGIDKTALTKYIQNLERVRVIRREYPITERKERGRSARYTFTDNYFRFWFRFVYPNKTLIEMDKSNELIKKIKFEYPTYMGHIFEDVCRDWTWKLRPINFTEARKWWHKEHEIDLILYGKGEIAFCECKWKELKRKEVEKILESLKDKSKLVKLKGKKKYCIFAKKIYGKEELKTKDTLLYDLRDFK